MSGGSACCSPDSKMRTPTGESLSGILASNEFWMASRTKPRNSVSLAKNSPCVASRFLNRGLTLLKCQANFTDGGFRAGKCRWIFISESCVRVHPVLSYSTRTGCQLASVDQLNLPGREKRGRMHFFLRFGPLTSNSEKLQTQMAFQFSNGLHRSLR